MRIQCQRALLFITCFCCTSILQTLSAQTVETAIRAVGNRYPLSKPVQLALSPSGTKFAVADQYGNRIYIMNTDGDLLWLIGSEIKLDLPTAVCFEQEDAILFSLQGKPEILRSFEKFPERIDTLATLSGKLKPFKGIDRLWKTRGNGFLLIDKSRNDVLAFDKD